MKTHARSVPHIISLSIFLIVQIAKISPLTADEVTAVPVPEPVPVPVQETAPKTERPESARYIEDTDDIDIDNDEDADEVVNSLIPPKFEDQGIHHYHFHFFETLLNSSKQLQAEFNSVEEMVADLEGWEAPEEMRLKYPYYLSGRDEEGRPIWAAELGRWDLRAVVEEGEEAVQTFRKYIGQLVYNVIKSFPKRESFEDSFDIGRELIFITDFDQLSLHQVGHFRTLTTFVQIVKEFEPILLKVAFSGYAVNTNYVAGRLLELLRPILGAVFERIEVFGANPVKWIPRLLRRLPSDQLPTWYGGPKDYKPVAIYG